MIEKEMSDTAIRRELGQRAQALRLTRDMDQGAFAFEAGVSGSTLYRFEQGKSVSLEAFIKMLRVLGLLDRLESLIPKDEISPIQRLRDSKSTVRKRASGSRKQKVGKKKPVWKGFKQQVFFEEK